MKWTKVLLLLVCWVCYASPSPLFLQYIGSPPETSFLRNLAKDCSSCLEIGGTEMAATWAILQGLSENSAPQRSYFGVDRKGLVLNTLYLAEELSEANGVAFHFSHNGLDMEEPVDLVVAHSFVNVDRALKYIVMPNGAELALWARSHPDWTVKERHGEFIVFARRPVLLDDSRHLYIDLMKKILTNVIYEDPCFGSEFNIHLREMGLDHPQQALTMVGMKRLDNIQYCLEQILQNQIPGDCIETGVWRGGCTIFMKAILKAYGDQTRRVWVADSFTGVPPPHIEKYPEDVISPLHTESYSYLAVPLWEVQNNFVKFGLLDEQVIFLEGLFSQTLPSAPIHQLALLRLDGDLYESTMDALVNLYPKLSVGGFVIIDDFGSNSNCVQALMDYRRWHGIDDEMIGIDFNGVYWKKTK